MTTIVGVRFRGTGKVYYFDPAGHTLHQGSHVIVETARGVEYGVCSSGVRQIPDDAVTAPLKPIIRVATEEDERRAAANVIKEKEAIFICKEKIRKHNLEMKLIDAEYTFDNNKVLFYFTADGRIDFRELVKDLAAVFRTRIELRQIGVRDETKILGGIGICGRELCCRTWLTDFVPVSIRMAKEQNLSLNPTKISGVCGRLMCCLKNEEETYEYLNAQLPSIGETVTTDSGLQGEVASVSVLRQKVRILVNVNDEKEMQEFDVSELHFKPRRRKEKKEDREKKEDKNRKNSRMMEVVTDEILDEYAQYPEYPQEPVLHMDAEDEEAADEGAVMQKTAEDEAVYPKRGEKASKEAEQKAEHIYQAEAEIQEPEKTADTDMHRADSVMNADEPKPQQTSKMAADLAALTAALLADEDAGGKPAEKPAVRPEKMSEEYAEKTAEEGVNAQILMEASQMLFADADDAEAKEHKLPEKNEEKVSAEVKKEDTALLGSMIYGEEEINTAQNTRSVQETSADGAAQQRERKEGSERRRHRDRFNRRERGDRADASENGERTQRREHAQHQERQNDVQDKERRHDAQRQERIEKEKNQDRNERKEKRERSENRHEDGRNRAERREKHGGDGKHHEKRENGNENRHDRHDRGMNHHGRKDGADALQRERKEHAENPSRTEHHGNGEGGGEEGRNHNGFRHRRHRRPHQGHDAQVNKNE